jgi:hypothetical protein
MTALHRSSHKEQQSKRQIFLFIFMALQSWKVQLRVFNSIAPA